MSLPKPDQPSTEMSAVNHVIAEALRPVPLSPERELQVQRLVMDRVRRSVASHRDLTTVRREDGDWLATGAGLRQRLLHEGHGMRVQLIQLAPHAAWPWLPGALAVEVLVVDGGIVVDGDGMSTCLSQFQQLVLGGDSALSLHAGEQGAQLYMRCRMVELDQLAPSEAQWWREAQSAPASEAVMPRDWSPFMEGADALDLRTHGGVASMLLRIAPGALLPDHPHELNEDCYMLDGDMYLGDVLIRAGDYQLAQAGGHHVGITSDEGGLFYFHGAMPGQASEAAS